MLRNLKLKQGTTLGSKPCPLWPKVHQEKPCNRSLSFCAVLKEQRLCHAIGEGQDSFRY